jgi:hypothetical protein
MIVAFNINGSLSLLNTDPLPTFGFLNYAVSFYQLVISCISIPLAVNFVFVKIWTFFMMLGLYDLVKIWIVSFWNDILLTHHDSLL